MSRPLAAVTGGAGTLGTRLVAALTAAGWRVRVLEHRRAVPGADETVPGGLLDAGALARLVEGASAVVHAAAVTHARSASAYERVNVEGTRALLEAARGGGVERVLLVSTSALDPAGGAYSRSKLAAEELAAAAPFPVTVVRLPELYGGGGREGLDELVARARAGRPLFVVGRGGQELRPVHVDDAVAVLLRALSAPAASGKTYTLAGERTTLRQAAETCVDALGSSSRIVGIPEPLVAAAARLARVLPLPLYPDQLARLRAPRPEPSPEAAEELGFAPRTLRQGLAGGSPEGAVRTS